MVARRRGDERGGARCAGVEGTTQYFPRRLVRRCVRIFEAERFSEHDGEATEGEGEDSAIPRSEPQCGVCGDTDRQDERVSEACEREKARLYFPRGTSAAISDYETGGNFVLA